MSVKKTRLLKVREVAERCDVKPRTVARWLRDGELPGVKLNTHTWRVEEAELEAFIASRRVQPE